LPPAVKRKKRRQVELPPTQFNGHFKKDAEEYTVEKKGVSAARKETEI
jgi:hypothetical protein